MRRKDQYIGRLYSYIGKVPSDSGIFGVSESYGNSPGEVMGLNGPYEKGEKGLKGWSRAPHWLVRIGLGGGGAPPPFLLPLLLFSSPTRKGGVLLPVGVGLPPWRASSWPAAPSPLILYIRGQGAPLGTTTIDPLGLLAVCGAPLHHSPPR